MEKINIKNLILTLMYALLTLTVLLKHEIWADEAQVWLVVRDLNLSGVFEHVRTEGHPLLWYLLVMPFAKMNFSVLSMQILNWSFMTSAAGFLLWKAPFNDFCKISILASSAFSYWFPIISRSYCLIPLLVFVLAWLYKKQKEHPYFYALSLILLANTHIIMFGFCSALGALFFYENIIKDRNKKAVAPFLITAVSLVSIIFYLSGSQSENVIVQTYIPNFSLPGLVEIYSKFIFNLFGFSNWFVGLLLGVFLIGTGIFLYLKDKKLFFVYSVNFIYQSAVFIFIWSILPQRAFSLIFVSIFCFWNVCENKTKMFISISLALIFLLSVSEGVNMIKKDVNSPFSDGKNTAEFIKAHLPQNAFILSNYPITTTPVSAYLPKDQWKFYYDGYKDFYTYTIWNKPIPLSSTPVPLLEEISKHDVVYVIMSAGAFYEDVRPIYTSPSNVLTNQEKFNIYEFRR